MEWLENSKGQRRSEFDGEVILSFEKNGRIQFKFRKNSIYKIISNEEYIVVANDGNKIYFKESNSKQGFRLSKWTSNSKIFKVLRPRFPLNEDDWAGEYNLEYDSKLGLHYICLNRKLEKGSLNWEGR